MNNITSELETLRHALKLAQTALENLTKTPKDSVTE